jgi:hypothetical protein
MKVGGRLGAGDGSISEFIIAPNTTAVVELIPVEVEVATMFALKNTCNPLTRVFIKEGVIATEAGRLEAVVDVIYLDCR